MVKNLPAVQETRIWSLCREDPLEKGMATHSSILAWEIPRTEGPSGLQSMGSQRIRHDWETNWNNYTKCNELKYNYNYSAQCEVIFFFFSLLRVLVATCRNTPCHVGPLIVARVLWVERNSGPFQANAWKSQSMIFQVISSSALGT